MAAPFPPPPSHLSPLQLQRATAADDGDSLLVERLCLLFVVDRTLDRRGNRFLASGHPVITRIRLRRP